MVETDSVPLGAARRCPTGTGTACRPARRAAQVGDEAAEVLVHAIDHRGVDRHPPGQVFPAVGVEAVPGRVHAPRPFALEPRKTRARRQRPVGPDRADGFHAGEALLTQAVPALAVDVGILRNSPARGVQREVRSSVSEVEEEGTAPGLAAPQPGSRGRDRSARRWCKTCRRRRSAAAGRRARRTAFSGPRSCRSRAAGRSIRRSRAGSDRGCRRCHLPIMRVR